MRKFKWSNSEMTKSKKPDIVQIGKADKRSKSGFRWVFYSDHGWDEIAIINANTISKSRKVQTRVIYTPNKKIIYEAAGN